jgi:hypothetical protein
VVSCIQDGDMAKKIGYNMYIKYQVAGLHLALGEGGKYGRHGMHRSVASVAIT